MLDVGSAVSKTVRLYLKLFGVLIGAALVVNAIVALLQEALIDSTSVSLAAQFRDLITLVVLSVVAASLITALSTHAVGDMEDGERNLNMTQLFSMAGPVIGAVIGVSILQGIGVMVGFLLLVIPGIFALTWWAVAVPAVVVERPGVIAAFRRSIELVRGNAWRVFGYGLLMILIIMIGAAVVGFVFALVGVDTLLGATVAGVLADSVMTPFGAVGYAVLYFELKRIEAGRALADDSWADDTSP